MSTTEEAAPTSWHLKAEQIRQQNAEAAAKEQAQQEAYKAQLLQTVKANEAAAQEKADQVMNDINAKYNADIQKAQEAERQQYQAFQAHNQQILQQADHAYREQANKVALIRFGAYAIVVLLLVLIVIKLSQISKKDN